MSFRYLSQDIYVFGRETRERSPIEIDDRENSQEGKHISYKDL